MLLPLGFLEFLGLQGILTLAIVGLLLYGERLPEVAASFAKQFVELKRSFQGIRNELESVVFDVKHSVEHGLEKADDLPHEDATAPKFEPPPAEEPPEPTADHAAKPDGTCLVGTLSDRHESGV
jgi:sec-independent protein translocase protein TatA